MRLSRLLTVILALLMTFGSAQGIIFGIRYSNLSGPVMTPFSSGENRGEFGIYFGEREKKSDFLLGIDYDRYKRQDGDIESYARSIMVDFGYRYRLFTGDRMTAMGIQPFAGIHYYKRFGKIEADTTVLSAQDLEYYKDISNDQGGWFSVGVEYYFAPAFSMGCEAGLLYSKAKSDAYGYDTKISEYRTFAAILMSFRF